jgi:ADP-ribose pyrophosphatase
MTPFRVVGSERRWTGDFLAADRVTIEDEHGERFERDVVRHPGAVAVVPVLSGTRDVLLVRQYRSAVGRELLEIVAGKRDVEGEPPEETAGRELEEELGHRARRLVNVGEFYNSPGFCDEYAYVYCALELEKLEHPHAVTAEEASMTVERVALDDVEELIAKREIVDAKTIIGLLLTRRFLADNPA